MNILEASDHLLQLFSVVINVYFINYKRKEHLFITEFYFYMY